MFVLQALLPHAQLTEHQRQMLSMAFHEHMWGHHVIPALHDLHLL